MKISYKLERLGHMHKNNFFLLFFYIMFFATFQRKIGILISDLYLYSKKIQANIKSRKLREKSQIFERIFFIFLKLFLLIYNIIL
jgi:hypothetical protein